MEVDLPVAIVLMMLWLPAALTIAWLTIGVPGC